MKVNRHKIILQKFLGSGIGMRGCERIELYYCTSFLQILYIFHTNFSLILLAPVVPGQVLDLYVPRRCIPMAMTFNEA